MATSSDGVGGGADASGSTHSASEKLVEVVLPQKPATHEKLSRLHAMVTIATSCPRAFVNDGRIANAAANAVIDFATSRKVEADFTCVVTQSRFASKRVEFSFYPSSDLFKIMTHESSSDDLVLPSSDDYFTFTFPSSESDLWPARRQRARRVRNPHFFRLANVTPEISYTELNAKLKDLGLDATFMRRNFMTLRQGEKELHVHDGSVYGYGVYTKPLTAGSVMRTSMVIQDRRVSVMIAEARSKAKTSQEVPSVVPDIAPVVETTPVTSLVTDSSAALVATSAPACELSSSPPASAATPAAPADKIPSAPLSAPLPKEPSPPAPIERSLRPRPPVPGTTSTTSTSAAAKPAASSTPSSTASSTTNTTTLLNKLKATQGGAKDSQHMNGGLRRVSTPRQ